MRIRQISQLGLARRYLAWAVVAALVATGVVVAWLSPGYAIQDLDLNDSGVWVTNPSGMLMGRANVAAGELDGALVAPTNQFDVIQDGAAIFLVNQADNELDLIDPARLSTPGNIALPAGSQAALGGGSLAVLGATEGSAWLVDLNHGETYSPEAPPILEGLGKTSQLAVGRDGTMHVANPAAGQLLSVAPGGTVTTTDLPSMGPDDAVQITAVGAQAVVLDQATGRLYLPGTNVALTGADDIQLQLPSDAGDAVVYTTGSAMMRQPLDGAAPAQIDASGRGVPTPPAVVSGCAYAVWAGSGHFLRDCPGKDNDASQALPGANERQDLRLRVNRHNVVVNEIPSGTVWLVTGQLVRLDDWDAVEPSEEEGEDDQERHTDKIEEAKPERGKQEPPVARDDRFGVRPGQSTVLRVVDNDSDPNGDLLTVRLVGDQPATGTVEPIYDATAFQITVPEAATGTATFTYEVSDGAGGTDQAKVTVEVQPPESNAPPAQQRKGVKVLVGAGAEAAYNVLPDWQDPDGDDLFLVEAITVEANSPDTVRASADGTITFQAAEASVGLKEVLMVVSDGQALAEGTMLFDIRNPGSTPPVANVDHAAGFVGEQVSVDLLANDFDPDGRQLRLTSVQESADLTSQVFTEAGVLTFVSDQAQTMYLNYGVSNGRNQAEGWVRLDITERPEERMGPVAVRDTALLPVGGKTLVNVLWNDVDPAGGVLVVTSVSAPEDGPVAVALLGHEIVQVTWRAEFIEAQTVTYTVANAYGSAEGTITVLAVPPPVKLSPPVTVDDQAVVRAGDVVTIHPLDNDYHPDARPFELVPDSVQVADPVDALVFTSQDTVRVHAGSDPKTIKLSYQITDFHNDPVSGQITVTITPPDPEHNSPPRPPDVSKRTVAGLETRIALPLDGCDPDGDFVSYVGVGTPPTMGTVTGFEDGFLVYVPATTAVGLDTFTYLVQDRLGARGEGQVSVGIVPPSGENQPPTAVDDMVLVKPERKVSVPVLANDSDPDGDPIVLVPDGVQSAHFEVSQKGNWVTFVSPAEEGSYSATYTVADQPWGATATGVISVEVSANAPPVKPLARDDVVGVDEVLAADGSVTVAVLENDVVPDGSIDDAVLEVTGGDAQVLNRQVKVSVTDQLQILDYSITNLDGLVGNAFVIVPGLEAAAPVFKMGVRPMEVKAGTTEVAALVDYVMVRPGRSPRVALNTITAVGGTAEVVSDTEVSFTAPPDGFGDGSITVQVTDGAGPDDPDGLMAGVIIPVKILPDPDSVTNTLQLTNPALTVEQGGQASLDLSPYAAASNPDLALSFQVGENQASGLTTSLNGAVLTVEAAKAAPKGNVALPLSVKDTADNQTEGQVEVRVVETTTPPPRAVDDQFGELESGKSASVDVLANDINPFPDTPLKVIGAQVIAGQASAPIIAGGQITVTPDANFHATLTMQYTIEDAVGRQASALVTGTVKGVPDQVTGLRVEEVGDKMVRLGWSVPANNGAPITEYIVSGTNGFTQSCGTANLCELTGLTNGRQYTFTVVARNAVGDSPPSAPSAPATPDKAPNLPTAPSVKWGDKQLVINWHDPGSGGTAISGYELQISPAPPSGVSTVQVSGTSYTWPGLVNGTAYKVRVCAKNQRVTMCDDETRWGPFSATEVPAGLAGTPGQPSVERLAPVGSQSQFKISWSPVDPNGDAVSAYVVSVRRGGTEIKTIDPTGAANATSAVASFDTSVDDYTFAVKAINKVGDTPWGAASAPIRSVLAPGPVTGLSANDADRGAVLDFGAPTTLNGARANELTYRFAVAGREEAVAPGGTVGGLTNNSTYSIEVWAVTQVGGVSYAGPRTTVSNVQPFGPPNPPTVTVSNPNAGEVRFQWSATPNGRPIVRVETRMRIDGGPWTDWRLNTGSTSWTAASSSYYQDFDFEAKTVDATGAYSSIVSAKGSTGPNPNRSVTVSVGGPQNTSYCVGANCRQVVVRGTAFKPNTTYTLFYSTDCGGPGYASFTQCRGAGNIDPYATTQITTDGNGNFTNTDRSFGYAVDVWASMDGITSAKTRFP